MEFAIQFSAGHFAADNRSSAAVRSPIGFRADLRRPTLLDEQAYPRRLDWPLATSLANLRGAVLCSTRPFVGVRVPVIGRPGVLPFEPPLSFWVSGHAGGPAVLASMRRGYFPANQEPRDWHVEYRLEFKRVPSALIPAEFRDRELEVPLCDLPLPEAHEFQEFEF